MREIHEKDQQSGAVWCTEKDCNATFDNKRTLNDHMRRTHKNTEEYPCNICRKNYLYKGDQQRHIKTIHNFDANKGYQCEKCDIIFPQKATLKRHTEKVHGENPLMSAITKKNQKKLHHVLKYNKMDIEQVGPLHKAVEGEQLNMVQKLLIAGANPNQSDPYGDTPMHIAGRKLNTPIWKLLSENGANLDITNSLKLTPKDCLRIAQENAGKGLHRKTVGKKPQKLMETKKFKKSREKMSRRMMSSNKIPKMQMKQ